MTPFQPQTSGASKVCILTGLLLVLLLVSGCQPGLSSSLPSSEATAQADQVNLVATRMARTAGAFQGERVALETQAARSHKDLLVEAALWPVYIDDSFQDNTFGWPVGEDLGGLADVAIQIEQGAFLWSAQAYNNFIYWAHPEMDYLENFYLLVEVAQVSGPPEASFGFVFRLGEEAYYIFGIDSLGRYDLYRFRLGEWEFILAGEQPQNILPSGINRLEIVARGSTFSFYINGEYLDEVDDPSLATGAVGLMIGLSEAGDSAQFSFTRFMLLSPDTRLEPSPTAIPNP
jgi:hypothetical protein